MTNKGCSFTNCTNVHVARGLCNGHYIQQRKGQELRPLVEKLPASARDDQGRKHCRDCRTWQPEDEFSKKPGTSDGLYTYCKACCKPRLRAALYGLTLDMYNELLAAQGGGCAICGDRDAVLAVDHDHSCCAGTKSCGACVRGLLCSSCNVAIGHLKDSPSLLRTAADYLEGAQR